jgi:hypothetical protein
LFGIIVKVATNGAPHTPLFMLQPWNFFKPMLLKTTITFIFIFSFDVVEQTEVKEKVR